MNWVRIAQILCLMRLYHCTSPADCNNETEYYSDKKCCFKCGPGSFLAAECKETQYSNCQPCSRGFYQEAWTRDRHCRPHSTCPEVPESMITSQCQRAKTIPQSPIMRARDFEKIEDGSLIQNVKCLCVEGKHCANKDCEICSSDSPCDPGSGVVTLADRRNRNTVCSACPGGRYSNVSSSTEPCKQWLNCSALGLVEDSPGSSITDVNCRGPPQGGEACRAAVGVLATVVVSLLALLILSYFGYLHRAVRAIQSQCPTRPQPKGPQQQQNGIQESCPTGSGESVEHPVQEVGKDSHHSEEEQVTVTRHLMEHGP